ncbi:MAG: pyridine nucleotide-disulfide oxidoreductase, partial [Lachnospiraceae bacterium]|nr:pyridine nucleotide-disulfide oxidoreductase [Lachnospiraceae bacterium]
MPEMSTKYVPEHKGEENYSEKILKLAQRITDRIGHKVTTDDPEYWGLACVIDDEIADVALTMKVRKPYTFDELCRMNNIAPDGREKFQALLDKMAKIGILEYDYGDKYTKDGPIPGTTYEPKDRRYWIPLFVPGSAEYTNMNLESLDKHPELAMFFERMTFLPLEKVTHLVPPGGAGIGMHVIPVEKAISMENGTIDIEHISYWLKRYEGHIGASICSCRVSRKKLDEGCADDFNDWCIGVGDMADYCRETGRGHDITYDEAMAILKRAEDNGFVHQITNIDGEGKIFAICNCNVKICNALRTSQLFNTPNMS